MKNAMKQAASKVITDECTQLKTEIGKDDSVLQKIPQLHQI